MRLPALAPLLLFGVAAAQGADDRPDRRVTDQDLQSAINQAIARGTDYLKRVQGADGSWDYDRADGTGGLTALALYALAASGLPASDPVVQKAVQWTERHDEPFSGIGRYGTYSASLLVLALIRVDAVAHKKRIHTLAGRIADSQLKNGQWTYFLLGDHSGGGTRAGTRAGWRRPSSPDDARALGDNSNTQFAVLALWAAQALADYDVPDQVWKRVQAFFARTQLDDGNWTYRDPGGTAATTARAPARARQPKLSMTAAGLVSWVYATASLQPRGERGIAGLAKARRAAIADQGLMAFFSRRLDWQWDDYYLVYSIERVGTVLGIPGESWYLHGSRQLVGSQDQEGSWNATARDGRDARRGHGDEKHVYETALALLFLSKATVYPLTGKR